MIDTLQGIIAASGEDLVNTRDGDDVITGEQKDGVGVFISNDPRRANLQMGGGNDTLTGISKSDIGILNRGFIYMGSGDDRLEIIDFEVIGGINSKKSERLEIDKGGTLVVRNNGSITLT